MRGREPGRSQRERASEGERARERDGKREGQKGDLARALTPPAMDEVAMSMSMRFKLRGGEGEMG